MTIIHGQGTSLRPLWNRLRGAPSLPRRRRASPADADRRRAVNQNRADRLGTARCRGARSRRGGPSFGTQEGPASEGNTVLGEASHQRLPLPLLCNADPSAR